MIGGHEFGAGVAGDIFNTDATNGWRGKCTTRQGLGTTKVSIGTSLFDLQEEHIYLITCAFIVY